MGTPLPYCPVLFRRRLRLRPTCRTSAIGRIHSSVPCVKRATYCSCVPSIDVSRMSPWKSTSTPPWRSCVPRKGNKLLGSPLLRRAESFHGDRPFAGRISPSTDKKSRNCVWNGRLAIWSHSPFKIPASLGPPCDHMDRSFFLEWRQRPFVENNEISIDCSDLGRRESAKVRSNRDWHASSWSERRKTISKQKGYSQLRKHRSRDTSTYKKESTRLPSPKRPSEAAIWGERFASCYISDRIFVNDGKMRERESHFIFKNNLVG
jgi:hypothetical protein